MSGAASMRAAAARSSSRASAPALKPSGDHDPSLDRCHSGPGAGHLPLDPVQGGQPLDLAAQQRFHVAHRPPELLTRLRVEPATLGTRS